MAGLLSTPDRKNTPEVPITSVPSPNIKPNPITQKARVERAKTTRFFARTFTAFFWRQKPASSIQKPAFIKNTSMAVTMTHMVSSPTFKPSVAAATLSRVGASCAIPETLPTPKMSSVKGRHACQLGDSRLIC